MHLDWNSPMIHHPRHLRTAAVLAVSCGPATDLDQPPATSTTENAPASSNTTASSDESSGTTAGTDENPLCGQALLPLQQDLLDQLFIVGEAIWSNRVQVGKSLLLSPVYASDQSTVHQASVCAEWSIEPVEGVSIFSSPPGALLSIEPSVPPGTVITVTADFEEGRRVVTQDFVTYVPIESSLIETWEEVLQLPCDGSEPVVPVPAIQAVVFTRASEFFVDWPSPVLYDYAGTFTYDETTGALSLVVEWGTNIPLDIDGDGTAAIVDGQLVLQDMWLGTAPEPGTPIACGHVFEVP